MTLGNYQWDPNTDLIAQGAFAEVFKAKDVNFSDRFVALKVYKEALIVGTTNNSSNQKKYSLENEFNKAIELSHTNIITFYNLNYLKYQDKLGRQVSSPVVAMEYAKEGTLKDFLGKQNVTIEDKVTLIKGILNGLGYLHEEGIIHRDLKPGNVLITRNRQGKPIAKITDFGISKDILSEVAADQSHTEGVGTPHYMAPEQFLKKAYGLNQDISRRTDIWGIGVIVYWVFARKLPFGSATKDFETIREAILNNEPDYSLIPQQFHNFLRSCFKKQASERADSCEVLKELLVNPVTEEPTVIVEEAKPTPQQPLPQPTTVRSSSKYFWSFFKPYGRINRTEYCIVLLVALFLSLYAFVVIYFSPNYFLSIILLILALYLLIVNSTKRSHDIGKSGWHQVIPFYHLLLLFLPGENENNEWGAKKTLHLKDILIPINRTTRIDYFLNVFFICIINLVSFIPYVVFYEGIFDLRFFALRQQYGYLVRLISYTFEYIHLYSLLIGLAYLLLFTFSICRLCYKATQRCHDIGKSGWYQLIPFFYLALLFIPGQNKENKWGPKR